MLKPKFLQKGDLVAIVSPSGPINMQYITSGKEILESWGLRVILGEHVCERYGVFAGTDFQRMSDFQTMLDNKEVRAIFCSRGGYGAIRIVEQIDYSQFLQNPKWIVGFSDITVFHAKMQSLGCMSIHGAMPKNFKNVTVDSLESLRNVLFGVLNPISWNAHPLQKNGSVRGKLIGGNLSMLYSMRSLPFEYDYSNTILFFEDLQEYVYHIDRIMQNLKVSGVLGSICGLIVGSMSNMKHGVDEYHTNVEQLISEVMDSYAIPLAFGFPSGHEEENMALLIGETYTLNVASEGCEIKGIEV